MFVVIYRWLAASVCVHAHACMYPRDNCSAVTLAGHSVRGSQQPCSSRPGRRIALGPEVHHRQLPFNKDHDHVEDVTPQVLPEADKRVMGKHHVSAEEGRE